MKITLLVPAEWQPNPRYAPLQEDAFLGALAQDVSNSLKQSVFLCRDKGFWLYEDIFTGIEWVSQPRNPQPTLRIEVKKRGGNLLLADADLAARQLATALRLNKILATLIPDCEVCLSVCFERRASIRSQ